jgi:ribulose-5-phosphate 4-epimerase/fuculose-1-phosphate aldolase
MMDTEDSGMTRSEQIWTKEVDRPRSELSADTIEQEIRERLVQQLITAFGDLAKSGLFGAAAGDASVRIPGTDRILVTPHMPILEQPRPGALLEVALDGRVLGKRGHPTLDAQIHLAIYKQRPEAAAIVHVHAPFATVLGICELPVPPVTFDAIPFMDIPRVPVCGLAGSQRAEEVAARLTDGAPAALLLHQGIVTVGMDLRQAVRRAVELEETARILVICQLLNQIPVTVPGEVVEILKHGGYDCL